MTSELYDVYVEGQVYPIATDQSLEDAERMDISFNAFRMINARLERSARSNPSGDESIQRLREVQASLLELMPSGIPDTKKKAVDSVQGREKSLVANLYNEFTLLQVEVLSINLAVSTVDTLGEVYRVFLNSGIVAKLIAARWSRFSKHLGNAESIEFSDLTDSEQNFLTDLLTSCGAFFDIENESSVESFIVDDFCKTLVLFPTDSALDKILKVVSTHTYGGPIMAHYAAPFLKALLIAYFIESDLSVWLATEKRDAPFDDVTDIFVTGNNVLTRNSAKKIMETAQNTPLLTPALKIAFSVFVDKNDSEESFKNPTVLDLFESVGIIPNERERISSKSLYIAYLAFTIAKSQSMEEILGSNLTSLKSSRQIIKILASLLKVAVTMTPTDALEYASGTNVEKKTYLEWAMPVVIDYILSNNWNSETYKSSLHTAKALVADPLLYAQIHKLAEELRRVNWTKFCGSTLLTTQLTSYESFDFAGEVSKNYALDDQFVRTYKPKYPKVFDALFPIDKFYCGNPLHGIFAASLQIDQKLFKNPKDFGLEELPTTFKYAGFRTYKSIKFHPLSIVGGYFWDCCLKSFAPAQDLALASFFADNGGYIANFYVSEESVACMALTGCADTTFKGTLKVPSEVSTQIVEGRKGLYLVLTDPRMSIVSQSFENNPNEHSVSGVFSLGGSEMGSSGEELSSDVKSQSAQALYISIQRSRYFRRLTTINPKGVKPYLIPAFDSLNLDGSEFLNLSGLSEYRNHTKDFKVEREVKAYTETGSEPPVARIVSSAYGMLNVNDTNLHFTEMHIEFDDEGDSAVIFYKSMSGTNTEPATVSWEYLQYMFAFAMHSAFVPYEGKLVFHTNGRNVATCRELLFPDWFKSANQKPLHVGNRTLRTKDLIAMRTPAGGAFINDTQFA